MQPISKVAALLALGLSVTAQALHPGNAGNAAAETTSTQHGTGYHHPLKVTIVADTNRDGRVDVTGDSDLLGKESWSRQRGALFLANIVDTDRRCSSRILNSTSDDDIDKCHDASDDVLRNPKFLAPLRTVPNSGLSRSAVGSLYIADYTADSMVRIFHKTREGWVFVTPEYTFSAKRLRAGIRLGIDARDVRRPGVWDGRVTVELLVRDGDAEARDRVALRVAPVLTHHHGQETKQVLSQASSLTGLPTALIPLDDPRGFRDDLWQHMFIHALENVTRSAGIERGLFLFNDTTEGATDIWVQDYFEPGYMSIPGPDGPVGLHVIIRSAQSWRRSGRLVFTSLRSNITGAVQFLAAGDSTDSMGNLETIPPHSHNGKSFPAGRIVMGSQWGVKPRITPFLLAQEEQSPVEIDTSWLFVGHTDEFLQFLPVDNELGWVMMVSDPKGGLEMLRKAQEAGFGGTAATSRARSLGNDPSCVPASTINEVLNLANFTIVQELCSRMIEKNVDIIKRETGIAEEHVVRLPALFYYDAKPFVGKMCRLDLGEDDDKEEPHRQEVEHDHDEHNPASKPGRVKHHLLRNVREAGTPPHRLRSRQEPSSEEKQVSAFYPGTINGIVLSRTKVVAPNPWGPLINGKDMMAAAVSETYASINYTVTFIDDWLSHHLGSGEVHCGTNTIRDFSDVWW
ncbi:protein-arginine deiminase (PAD) domain-containing protein [Hirsutella rhossiliensis]|uniref:Protein-arginine deiminase (PAD) domain-containing protein n=1 Tax=Hirsutella rhossiliensis TaxID=111463 RepID=A0A9P8MVM8_9HYPO|nr:protein-arginine deiminase (PAD) domain-containing protein [Hirsutella rhossiliensis]KAH0961076.1 protein-arginine deiminase (PAD) domain-containing protein [Hirsutella rhossiliensis]